MKKLLFASLIVALLCTTTYAQDKNKVEFGFHIGGSQSTITFENYTTAEESYSFNAGASAEYYFSPSWGIKARLIYDRKGWDEGGIEIGGDYFLTDYNLDYLTIPVTANWHFGRKKDWYLHFGVYYGILLKAEETAFGLDVKDAFFKSSDFGLDYGIGYKFELNSRLKLFLEADFQGGLSDISKDAYSDVLNSRGSLNVGINFLMN